MQGSTIVLAAIVFLVLFVLLGKLTPTNPPKVDAPLAVVVAVEDVDTAAAAASADVNENDDAVGTEEVDAAAGTEEVDAAAGNDAEQTPPAVESMCTNCAIVEHAPSIPPASQTGAGTKYALLIGCNYAFAGSPCISQNCVLRGCIQDVTEVAHLLANVCSFSHITVLTDDVAANTPAFPSKKNIVDNIRAMIAALVPGDVLFIWFSGHGVQVRNSGSDGGYDECWVPADSLSNGNYLRDNELNALLAATPEGVRAFVGSDSCHSGTVLDLRFILSEDGDGENARLTSKSLSRVRGRVEIDVPETPTFHAAGQYVATVPARSIFSATAMATPTPTSKNITHPPLLIVEDSAFSYTRGWIVALSGCADPQTSADTVEDGIPQGAMTWAFVATIKRVLGTGGTFADLLRGMRELLSVNSYTQVPQIQLGKLFDPNTTLLSDFLQMSEYKVVAARIGHSKRLGQMSLKKKKHM